MSETETAREPDREAAVTGEVLASFGDAPDPRFRAVMTGLVRHLHAFAREVCLTEAEWHAAIAFLTRVGHITDDRRQEFVLLSDVLGLSMLTVAINHPPGTAATESTVFGPFFVEDAPLFENGENLSGGLAGRPCHVLGSVSGDDGSPLPGARIEVWAADDEGNYDVQVSATELAGRGHLFAGADGRYEFWTVQPAAYPIPHDGPVGDLLASAARSVMRPAHIHFMVSHPGYDTLVTHIFVAGDEWLTSDAVFGVKQSLVLPFDVKPAERAPADSGVTTEWSEAVFDIRLARSRESG
jgi:hydroxyquinol 1,2-dioxygenase